MNFLKSIINETDPITDEEVKNFIDEVMELDNIDELDEDAFSRIAKRVEARDLAMYRYIVGASNLMGTKNFLELAKKGKGVSSTMVKAYYPAIEMLDDIVTAGPGYVQLLKALHSRAKKSN